MRIEEYNNTIKFSHFKDGLLSDREIYIDKKEDNTISICLEDSNYYSYINMSEEDCSQLVNKLTEFLNNKRDENNI